ncbi:unnamed protein product [Leptidea sinapis]|uniref:LRRNT domain-containing protein n=1 Tax=Leptidea sinapis TaxID=189913 RepID=A0A5E4PNV7_9NEOP|nr:unnamed protein product [Leptidea sinapis]
MVTCCTLTLSGNPLQCTCHISWLASWLRARRLVTSATCHYPPPLRDTDITHLEIADFKCAPEDVGCLPPDYCPVGCSCTGSVVRCARGKLTTVPSRIPPYTTELYLESNELTSISSEQVKHLVHLTRLDLSNNKISVLSNNTFEALTKLVMLSKVLVSCGCSPSTGTISPCSLMESSGIWSPYLMLGKVGCRVCGARNSAV